MPSYHPAFKVADIVFIAPREALLAFRNQWPDYQHIPSMDLLQYAEVQCIVRDIHYAHGGDCLYKLERYDNQTEMSVWHEDCVVESTSELPRANTIYTAFAELRDTFTVVVIRDMLGHEYLTKKINSHEEYSHCVNQTATIRTIRGFENRYEFDGRASE